MATYINDRNEQIFLESAFPAEKESGMSLRDYFAARAIQGQAAGARDEEMPELARRAYAMADALILERSHK